MELWLSTTPGAEETGGSQVPLLRWTFRNCPLRSVTVLPVSVTVTVTVGLADQVAVAVGQGGPGVT